MKGLLFENRINQIINRPELEFFLRARGRDVMDLQEAIFKAGMDSEKLHPEFKEIIERAEWAIKHLPMEDTE